jgi:hypothetical protein
MADTFIGEVKGLERCFSLSNFCVVKLFSCEIVAGTFSSGSLLVTAPREGLRTLCRGDTKSGFDYWCSEVVILF